MDCMFLFGWLRGASVGCAVDCMFLTPRGSQSDSLNCIPLRADAAEVGEDLPAAARLTFRAGL